jgi:hypothetical protein
MKIYYEDIFRAKKYKYINILNLFSIITPETYLSFELGQMKKKFHRDQPLVFFNFLYLIRYLYFCINV